MSSPPPSSPKVTFVMRDQDLPLADQIRNTCGDIYEYVAAVRVVLDELGPRITNIEASLETQQGHIASVVSMCERILQLHETPHALPQPSTSSANQNGSNGT
ncbi:hypothetical protein HOY82DRAFT_669936 [Tuber indicum]|nr:hypothetical protein HOY82DRAFT_669936 [Tuber indicum]